MLVFEVDREQGFVPLSQVPWITVCSADPPPKRKLSAKSAFISKKYMKPTMDIYHVDGLPYESLMVALISTTLGPAVEETESNSCDQGVWPISLPSRCHADACTVAVNPTFGFSRDGFHVSRKELDAPISEGKDLSRSYPQFGHSLLVTENKLAFYLITKDAFVWNNCTKGIEHEVCCSVSACLDRHPRLVPTGSSEIRHPQGDDATRCMYVCIHRSLFSC